MTNYENPARVSEHTVWFYGVGIFCDEDHEVLQRVAKRINSAIRPLLALHEVDRKELNDLREKVKGKARLDPIARAEDLQKENEEQARLLSMSAERETALLDKVRRLENMLGQYLDGPDAPRITDWAMSSPRKPANVAFTAGPERQIAYWIEWAQEQVKRK